MVKSGSGWLGAIISGLFGASQQASQMAFDSRQAEINRDFQSAEAEKNRIFQSDEAALQRDWSSQEAERARDWNEEMYAKYNSLSGKIKQAQDAGVNPLLAVTGNSVSPLSTGASAPSGASAGSVGTPSGDSASMAFVDIIGKVLGFKHLQSQIDVANALADKYRSEAENTSWLSRLNARQYKIITENNFDVQQIEASLSLSTEQANLAFQEAGKVFEEAGKIALEKEFDEKSFDDRLKIVEYEKLIKDFESSISSVLDSIDNGQKADLSSWVSAILKALLYIK